MRYKKVKNMKEEISQISIGTWAIGGKNSAGGGYGEVDEKESVEAIQTMIEHGVNLIDTAPIYGEGNSEIVVGKAIKGLRDKVLVATKFGSYISHYTGKAVRNNSYNFVMRECEDSLQRLGVDHIDIYLMHWPDANTPMEETMAVLNDLKKQGKIRYIGLCNSNKELVGEAMQFGQVDMIQVPFSMVNQSDAELMEWAEMQGIGVMTWGSLGSGILTGSIREMPKFDEKDFRNTFYPFYKEPMFSNIMTFLKTMDQISETYHKPLAQMAINWNTQKSYVSTSIVGVRNKWEAVENCNTFNWELAPEEIALLDSKLKELNIG